jgi:hypothetical protein
MKRKRARASPQYADAEIITLSDLVAELSRAIGKMPAWAAVREAWLADKVTIVGRKLVFDDAEAALSADLRKIDRQETVRVLPATLLKWEAIGLKPDQIAAANTVYFTASHLLDPPRARLFLYAVRADAAKQWPGIIAPPIRQSPVQAIASKPRKKASPTLDAIKARLDEKFPNKTARDNYPIKAIARMLGLPDSQRDTLRRALGRKKERRVRTRPRAH